MTKDELIAKLLDLGAVPAEEYSESDAHYAADRALLAYINDDDVTEAFDALHKWYE